MSRRSLGFARPRSKVSAQTAPAELKEVAKDESAVSGEREEAEKPQPAIDKIVIKGGDLSEESIRRTLEQNLLRRQRRR